MNNNLNKEYFEHNIFEELNQYSQFYKSLSYSVMNWISMGTKSIINIDTYIFTSTQGTLESINDILLKGRINDAYALLRKYYDITIINIYINLYIEDNFNLDTIIVEKINNWIKGTEELPSFGKMSNYIIKSNRASVITNLLYGKGTFKGSSFENLRKRCNDHTHYLYYHNLMTNDNSVFLKNRQNLLNEFSSDLEKVFILHLSYLFFIKDHYMMASDYRDSLDLGITPEIDSQYWVANFIQDIFDKVIKVNSPDIFIAIKNNTMMKLI